MYKTRKKNVLDNLVAEKRQGWITTGVYIKTEVETVIIERERKRDNSSSCSGFYMLECSREIQWF